MPKRQQHQRRRRHKAKPIDLIPVMTGKKPWYESKTVWGLLMVILPLLLGKFGLSVDTDGLEPALRALLTDVRELVGSALVVWGTVSRKRAPLTLTGESKGKLP